MNFGRRIVSPEDFARTLPAYSLIEGGSGYYYDSAEGRVMVTGAIAGDQLVEKDGLGVINVSKALEYLNDRNPEVHLVPIDDGLKENIRLIDVNMEYVRKLRASQLKQPILLSTSDTGVQVLDGHHRLSRMILDRKREYPAIVMAPEGLAKFQVCSWLQDAEGQWKMTGGATEKYLANMIARARSKWGHHDFLRRSTPV